MHGVDSCVVGSVAFRGAMGACDVTTWTDVPKTMLRLVAKAAVLRDAESVGRLVSAARAYAEADYALGIGTPDYIAHDRARHELLEAAEAMVKR